MPLNDRGGESRRGSSFESLESRRMLSAAATEPVAGVTPPTPTGVDAVLIAPRAARLSWADVAGETGYRVERRVDGSTDPWVAVTRTAANVVTVTNDGLLLGRTYLYRVVAFNEAGDSAPSEPDAVTTPNESDLPPVPTGLDATLVAPRAIKVTWNDVAGETGYVVERRTDGTTEPWARVGSTDADVTTFTNEGLLPNRTYLYRVRSVNAVGPSSPSNVDFVTTPPEDGTVPAAPREFDATLVAPRAARLTWADVTGERGYKIERRIDGSADDWAQIATVGENVTSYGNDGLLAGKTYLYRVRAFNAAGDSPYSNVDFVTTEPEVPAPPAPTGLEVVLLEPRVARLTWNDVAGETGYIVERKLDGTVEWSRAGSTAADVTTFTEDGLLAGKTYLYRVRAVNGSRVSEPSNVDSVTTAPEVPAPPAPTGLEAVLLEPRVARVTWNDVDGETGYVIERKLDGAVEWARVGSTAADATTFTEDGLLPGKTYLYRVRAVNGSRVSEPSNVDSVTTPGETPAVPAAPRLEAALIGPRAIRLNWTNVANEAGYKIERRVDGTPEPYAQIATTAADVTTYVDDGLEPGKTYLYRVRAFNDAGNSPYSNTAYRTTPRDGVAPATPTGVEATLIAPRAVRVTWNDVENERGYRIERRLDGSTEAWRVVGTAGANVTSFTEDGLLPGRTYLYRVRAFNEAGTSEPSAVASVRTPGETGVPAAPRLDASLVGARAIRLVWSDVDAEQGYKIERRVDGTDGPWTQIATTAANVTTYVDEGLEPGKTYIYRVRAFNEAGDSPYSNADYAATPGENTAPAAPRELRAVAARPTVIELRWNNVANENGYRVERRLDGSDAWHEVGTTAADVTTFRDAQVMPRRTYIYRVRAFNDFGNSPYSNTASATTPRGDVVIGTGNGLLGTYFNNADLTDPRLRRVDPTVNFEWGYGSPAPVIDANSFSVRWTGRVLAQFTETYRFFTRSDDGVRLWVNDRLLIDDWTHHATAERSGSIALEAGKKYNLRLEYFEGNGNAVARLLWGSPSTEKQVVPRSQLYAASAESVAPRPAETSSTVDSGGAVHELLTANALERAAARRAAAGL